MPQREDQGLLISFTVSLILHLALITPSHLHPPLITLPPPIKSLTAIHLVALSSQNTQAVLPKSKAPDEANLPPATQGKTGVETETFAPSLVTDLSPQLENLTIDELGKITLRLLISRSGRPKKLEVINSSFSKPIEAQIVKLFFEAQYKPGSLNGKPADMVAEFEVGSQ